ncbi:MAG: single-stranded DNA-binding protein [Bacteroidales bacterium]|nr:single-stranded DNA-binding protein [Bacteroidales bacterium]
MNKIELRGVVGRAEISNYNNSRVCNFSVVTERSTRDGSGNSAVETTWFNVSVWDSVDNPKLPLENIVKGSWVEVTGRLRMRPYTTAEQEYRLSLEVSAWDVKTLSKEGQDPHMQPQRD